MPPAAKQKRRPIDQNAPENQHYLLAAALLRRWRAITGLPNAHFARLAQMDTATFSTAAAGKFFVSEETWVNIGEGLGWGGFFEYVMRGNIDAAERCEFVPESIRIPGVEQLRKIA